MDTKKPLVIGYSGSLAFYEGEKQPVKGGGVRDWIWTYNHMVTDPSTRSASFLFRAVSELKKKYNITPLQLKITLWGKIDPLYLRQAKDLDISELVSIEGYLSKAVSVERNSACDVLFLPMESATSGGKPLFIPGKAFEYMNAGKPILALSGPCDCISVLEPSGLLARFEPQDTNGILEWLHSVISDRQRLHLLKPDTAYIERFSFRNIVGKIAGVFDEVLESSHNT